MKIAIFMRFKQMTILSAHRQCHISRKSLIFRLHALFSVIGLICIVSMTTPAHASQAIASPAQPTETTNQQENSSPKKQASNDPKKNEPSETIDPARVREEIDAIRTDNSLPDEMRARCQEILTATLKDIESREEDQLQIQQLVKAAETSEQRKKAVENSGNKPITIALDGVTPDSNATKIEELLRSLNKDLLATTLEANRIQKELNARRTETKALPVQISKNEEELNALGNPEENTDSNPVLTTALKQATIAKRAKLVTALELCRQKIVTYDAEASVLPLEKASLDKRADALSKAITDVNAWVTQRHTDDITKRIAEYRSSVTENDFDDTNDYEHFFALLDLWPLTVANAESWNSQLLALKEKTNSLRDDFQETASLVDADRATGSGLSRTAGYLLRRKHVMLNRERTMLSQS